MYVIAIDILEDKKQRLGQVILYFEDGSREEYTGPLEDLPRVIEDIRALNTSHGTNFVEVPATAQTAPWLN